MDTGQPKLDDAGWEAALGIGHNNPPEPTPFERLKAEADERIDTANRWITERPTITDADMAEKATSFRDQLAATYKATEAQRKADKDPHMVAAKAVDDQYKPTLSLLESAGKAIKDRLTAYMVAEQAKLDEAKRQREEAAKLALAELAQAQWRAEEESRKAGGDVLRAQAAAEAAAKAAADAEKAAAEPVRAAVKGDYSKRATTLRVTWHSRIIDEKAALKAYAKHPSIRAAALAAIREVSAQEAKIRKGAAPPDGIEFYKTETAV